MPLALKLLLLAVVVAASLGSLLFLLPWLKEGFGIEELPLFATASVTLAVVALLWWLVHRKRRGTVYVLGLVALAAPLGAYVFLSALVLVNDWRGRRLARTVRVVSLRETSIHWPGLDAPIGVRLDLEIDQEIALEGNLFPPKIVMGSNPRPTYRDYFSAMDRGIDKTLETNAYQPGAPETPRDIVLAPGRIRLSYELFPSILLRRDGKALCLADRAFAGRPRSILAEGGDLGAAWFFAGAGGVIVDMSDALTDALRRSSRLQGRPEEWRRLMDRLASESLDAQGFERCAAPHPGSFEICFCGPVAAAPAS